MFLQGSPESLLHMPLLFWACHLLHLHHQGWTLLLLPALPAAAV
jgi:hypothetical protein